MTTKTVSTEPDSVKPSAMEARWREKLALLENAKTPIEYAEAYAQLGIEIVPAMHGKIMNAKGISDATSDILTILRWWRSHPRAQIVIRTGRSSNLMALIFDTDKNPKCMKQWCDKYGRIPFSLSAYQAGEFHFVYLRRPRVKSVLLSRDCFGGVNGVSAQLDDGWVTAPGSGDISLFEIEPIRTFPKRFYPALWRSVRSRALPPLLKRKAGDNKNDKTAIAESVRTALLQTLPDAAGQGNKRVAVLAQKLRPQTDKFDSALATFDQWFALSLSRGFIRDSYATYRRKFERAWKNAWTSRDGGMLRDLEYARTHPFPTQSSQFTNPKQQLLLALCARLEDRLRAGKMEEWHLSAREAGKLLDVDKCYSCRWLREFVSVGLLRCTPVAGFRKAFRYRFNSNL